MVQQSEAVSTCTTTNQEHLVDIEDVIERGNPAEIARFVSSPNVTLRVKRKQQRILDDIQLDSFVPGWLIVLIVIN